MKDISQQLMCTTNEMSEQQRKKLGRLRVTTDTICDRIMKVTPEKRIIVDCHGFTITKGIS